MKSDDQQGLHIVCFNNPYPPNYGGVIDVYYKIKSLHEIGIKIILHVFNYGRNPSPEIESFSYKTYYYERKKNFKYLFSAKPFIAITRKNKDLLKNLLKFEYPILFEGLHCCNFLNHRSILDRKKVVRSHNIEHDYYFHLSKRENNLLKKIFFRLESYKLRKFEKTLENADKIISISPNDHEYFNKKFKSSIYIPAFIPSIKNIKRTPSNNYILFHGNLSVAENIKSLIFFIDTIFPHIKDKIVIAGLNPTNSVRERIKKFKNIELISNPSIEEMTSIISNAKCILLHTFQATGIKLKLLISLIQGGTCIANTLMVSNTGLEKYCTIADNNDAWLSAIKKIMLLNQNESYSKDNAQEVLNIFDNKKNGIEIAKLLY